jgi:hypothetical protein
MARLREFYPEILARSRQVSRDRRRSRSFSPFSSGLGSSRRISIILSLVSWSRVHHCAHNGCKHGQTEFSGWNLPVSVRDVSLSTVSFTTTSNPRKLFNPRKLDPPPPPPPPPSTEMGSRRPTRKARKAERWSVLLLAALAEAVGAEGAWC